MSYILEALKKSESERHQGRVPDLGQQMRMIHRKRRRGIPALAWFALALMANAIVLAVLFWPGHGVMAPGPVLDPATSSPARVAVEVPQEATPAEKPAELTVSKESGAVEVTAPAGPASEPAEAVVASGQDGTLDAGPGDAVDEAPTVIVPTIRPAGDRTEQYTPAPWDGRVPHLVEMPMAFQRRVPDLEFSSHVYSSNPGARSVMINSQFLRMGESLGRLRVERITEDGVELSLDGQRFRVGVVRDWSSPR